MLLPYLDAFPIHQHLGKRQMQRVWRVPSFKEGAWFENFDAEILFWALVSGSKSFCPLRLVTVVFSFLTICSSPVSGRHSLFLHNFRSHLSLRLPLEAFPFQVFD